MSLENFLANLEGNKRSGFQITEHRYIHPLGPSHRKLDLNARLSDVLKGLGIVRFWSHQAEAIDLIRQGENVVVMTPTASGKSLIYNIPVIESIIDTPDTKALYIFPLKGLEQDQAINLNRLFSAVGHDLSPAKPSRIRLMPAEVYDGDTTPYRREKIRNHLPNVIFTNPDMLHLAINQFHSKWEGFFKNLKYVLIDEIHTYRGVFGSNVAHVLRRLRRICRYYNSNPQFIACSATIANPKQLAEGLVGVPFKSIEESGAPRTGKHFIFLNPQDSPYTAATRIFLECLEAGLKTIVFTKARKITELIYRWVTERAPELAGRVSPYRAGFLPKERREIEQRLFNGELQGVVSTSALELGVDIGGLDACILVGYPGSVSSTWQRAGRVGRHGQESVIIMVGMQDALDQYIMRHPDIFFGQSHEAAVIDPDNRKILKQHLPCAAAEVYLRGDDKVYDPERLRPVIDELVSEGHLSAGKKGDIWFSKKRMPHREAGIRAIGEPFDIMDENNRGIGELNGYRVFREAFPGAIYLHRGRQYKVMDLDTERKKVICRETDVPYYTQALGRDETAIIGEKDTKRLASLTIEWGLLSISSRITGYEKKNIFDRTRLSRHELVMPEYLFETEGLWIALDDRILNAIDAHGFDLAGSMHAVEHASIACMPLFSLCDKGDIGGLSYTLYPGLKKPVIFVYDGHEGGIGLTRRAFDVADEWLRTALAIITECGCDSGCPACVQDPQCGSGNQPLDKEGAEFILRKWTDS